MGSFPDIVRAPARWLCERLAALGHAKVRTASDVIAYCELDALERERASPERVALLRASLNRTSHWLPRMAAGALPTPPGLPADLRDAILAERDRIAKLRTARKRARSLSPTTTIKLHTSFRHKSPVNCGLDVSVTRKRGAGGRPLAVDWRLAGYVWEPRRFPSRRMALRHAAECRKWRTVWKSKYVTAAYLRHLRQWAITCNGFGLATGAQISREYPTREAAARWLRDVVIPEARKRNASLPDPNANAALGWRCWTIDPLTGILHSPLRIAAWPDGELRCDDFPESPHGQPESAAGIYALLMPRDWKRAGTESLPFDANQTAEDSLVTGVVERFGRYILGAKGWRAEWVVIRELQAQTVETKTLLERQYPNIPVWLAPPANSDKEGPHT